MSQPQTRSTPNPNAPPPAKTSPSKKKRARPRRDNTARPSVAKGSGPQAIKNELGDRKKAAKVEDELKKQMARIKASDESGVKAKSELSTMEYASLPYSAKAASHKREFEKRNALPFSGSGKPNALPPYVFHATSTDLLTSIREYGLLTPNVVRAMAAMKTQGQTPTLSDLNNAAKTIPESGKDPSKDGFVSAAASVSGAGAMSSKSSLLRFKPEDTGGDWKSYGAAGEIRTIALVPPSCLELGVLNPNTQQYDWVPL